MRLHIALGKEDWFHELTREEQENYIKQHPASKYVVDAIKKSEKPTVAPKPSVATVIVDGHRVQSDGNPLPDHIVKLSIPPKWVDVKFNPDSNGALLATGRDAKGRLQSIYSDSFSKTQAEAKFKRVQALAGEFEGISKENESNRRSRNPRIKDSADCLMLIMATGLRPGSDTDTGAQVKAYGATTLMGKHVVIKKNSVTLDFVGKKGVHLQIPVTDPAVIAMLKRRTKEVGPEGDLFSKTSEKTLLDYTHTLDGGNFKTKDFRTHLGTHTAIEEMRSLPKPKSMSEYKKAVMNVAKKVAAKLGNTPTIALQSYINPVVFAEWQL